MTTSQTFTINRSKALHSEVIQTLEKIEIDQSNPIFMRISDLAPEPDLRKLVYVESKGAKADRAVKVKLSTTEKKEKNHKNWGTYNTVVTTDIVIGRVVNESAGIRLPADEVVFVPIFPDYLVNRLNARNAYISKSEISSAMQQKALKTPLEDEDDLQRLDKIAESLYDRLEPFCELFNSIQIDQQDAVSNRKKLLKSCKSFFMLQQAVRHGYLRALEETVNSKQQFVIYRILELISALTSCETTRLDKADFNKQFVSITGKEVTSSSYAELAKLIIYLYEQGAIRLYKKDELGQPLLDQAGKPIDVLVETLDNAQMITRFFEYLMSYRYRDSVLHYKQYERDLAMLEARPQHDQYVARIADPTNVNEMAVAILDKRPRGRPGAGSRGPRFLLPEAKRGRPSKQLLEVKKSAEALALQLKSMSETEINQLVGLPGVTDWAKTKARINEYEKLGTLQQPNYSNKLADDESDLYRRRYISPSELVRVAAIDTSTHTWDPQTSQYSGVGVLANNKGKFGNCVKICLVRDTRTRDVILYRLYPGATSDMKILEEVIPELKKLNYRKFIVVADRGFCSLLLQRNMLTENIQFVLKSKANSLRDQQIREEILKEFAHDILHRKTYSPEHKRDFITKSFSAVELGFCDQEGYVLNEDNDQHLLDAENRRIKIDPNHKFYFTVSLNYYTLIKVQHKVLDKIYNLQSYLNSEHLVATELKALQQEFSDSFQHLQVVDGRWEIVYENIFDFSEVQEANSLLISTVEELANDKSLAGHIYDLRWTIENFFKNVKNAFGRNGSGYAHSDENLAVRFGLLYASIALVDYIRGDVSELVHLHPVEYSELQKNVLDVSKLLNKDNFPLYSESAEEQLGSESMHGRRARISTNTPKLTIRYIESVQKAAVKGLHNAPSVSE